ncbi:Glycosyltransferase sugar-binding region containing DXD motif [Rhizoctonia solani]|uniref:Glycosyltransferase sugar-binding region containing DXD motif n=1 Tax=Rhizoctonia solani TaxID=456999 RepID=A0A8H7IKT3_9AGAM|nr:Glycosyltransferase sugar-binding region containing DXD motif [Rhizoctonia solani]
MQNPTKVAPAAAFFVLLSILFLNPFSEKYQHGEASVDCGLVDTGIVPDTSSAFIYEDEVPANAWTDTLPERWQAVSKTCRDMMPDYEYMLWTDQASDDFIAEHYSWFLPTFRAYTYPIQRADAIRYFVLHHYGGVYLDLDVGCNRRLDPLLTYPLSLFASRNPTIANQVRVLSKPLYGKNAKPDEAPHAFFAHYYGSSWHADDAGFITFLGSHGRLLMILGLALLLFGLYRVFRTGAPSSPVRRRRGSRLPHRLHRQPLVLNKTFSSSSPPFFSPVAIAVATRTKVTNFLRIRSPAPLHEKDLEAGSALGLGLSSSSSARVSQDVRSRPSTPELRPPPYSTSSSSPSTSRWSGWAPWSPAVDRS